MLSLHWGSTACTARGQGKCPLLLTATTRLALPQPTRRCSRMQARYLILFFISI
jgi:hypothetical protein